MTPQRIIKFGKRATQSDVACVILGRLGMSGQCIADRTGLSVGQVFGRLKMAGISLKDYRNGRTEFAQKVIAIAHEEAGHTLNDIKDMIRKALPPASQPKQGQDESAG